MKNNANAIQIHATNAALTHNVHLEISYPQNGLTIKSLNPIVFTHKHAGAEPMNETAPSQKTL